MRIGNMEVLACFENNNKQERLDHHFNDWNVRKENVNFLILLVFKCSYDNFLHTKVYHYMIFLL